MKQMSITGHEIRSNFYLNRDEYDAFITVRIEGKDKLLISKLMNQICFEVSPTEFEFQATLPTPNTNSLERFILVKKKEI